MTTQTATLLDLTKKFELSLEKNNFEPATLPKMAVHLAIDKSGSMAEAFADGYVQHITDLFLAAAMKFDDNQTLEVGFFNTSLHRTPDAKAEDFRNYVRKVGASAGGGTAYLPILNAFCTNLPVETPAAPEKQGFFSKLFGKEPAPVAATPKPAYSGPRSYLTIITDGEAYDQDAFEAQLRDRVDPQRNFVQIIALGDQVDTDYLNGLNAKFSNVAFMQLLQPKTVSE